MSAIASRAAELDALIRDIDRDIAVIRAKLPDFSSEQAITSGSGVGAIGNHGEQRLEQLLALRKTYEDERRGLPLFFDVSMEAGTDLLGNNLDEHG